METAKYAVIVDDTLRQEVKQITDVSQATTLESQLVRCMEKKHKGDKKDGIEKYLNNKYSHVAPDLIHAGLYDECLAILGEKKSGKLSQEVKASPKKKSASSVKSEVMHG